MFCFKTINLVSQSRYLENGISGSQFQLNTTIDSTGVNSLGLSSAYSIGGIMDIGFNLARATAMLEGFDSTEWSFDFLYNIIVLKQSENMPLSLQLEGLYGYTNVSSAYLDANAKTYDGQGFLVGASIFREFNKKGLFSFLIGAKGIYRNYMFTETTTTVTDPGPPIVSSTTTTSNRREKFAFGGIAAVSLRPKKWPIFTIEVEVLYDQSENDILFIPTFLIISPRY